MTGYLALNARIKRSSSQYLVKRFLRMYPVFWLLLFLTFLEFDANTLSVKDWLANATLFEDFLFCPKVIGASWMLPMRWCFLLHW